MKRSFIYGLLSLCFCLVGCSKRVKEGPPKEGRLKVLSTTAMIGDVVKEIGGDRIHASTLILGEIDPHSYELVKGDDEKIGEASLLFFNGLNLEHGASLRYKITSHPGAISVGDYILKKYPDKILFEQGQVDPHIWMDVSLWSYIIDPIVEALKQKDPEGKEYYEERAIKVQEEMMHVHQKIQDRLKEVPENKRYLVTSHDAFTYFTRAYLATDEERVLGTWTERFSAPEGFAPDGQLGAADLQKIVYYIIKHQVNVVFPESNVSPDSLNKIVFACKEKGIPVRRSSQPLYGDSMGSNKSSSHYYLGMMEYDAMVLMKEWE